MTTTTQTPTAILSAEHRHIESALDVLEVMAARFEEQGAIDDDAAGRAIDFIRTFADRCHHGKEEEQLFPAIEAKGLPAEHGPTAMMRAEHVMGRGHVADMDAAVKASDPAAFVDAARAYVALLEAHIHKEDEVLFPMAEDMLSDDDRAKLLAAFTRVETDDLGPGTHERMLAVLEGLRQEFGVEPRAGLSPGGGCAGTCGCAH